MRAAVLIAVLAALVGSCLPALAANWYETTKIDGYVQGRFYFYPDAEGDEKDSEFEVRRARIKVSAKPADDVAVEIQADLTNEVETKDAWIQKWFGRDNESSLRIGQQKVAFGWEGPQSSGSRLPLERNWVARRTIDGERDTGLTFFWTCAEDKKLFETGKKKHFGTGDYGNLAVAFFNGQGINNAEVNDSKHFVIRGAKPMLVKLGDNAEQYVEFGASYYTGEYVSMSGDEDEAEFDDNLLNLFAYMAPQPIGVQAEWFDGETEGADLDGFYVMGMYRPEDGQGTFYARYDEMNGNRKGRQRAHNTDRITVGYAHELEDGKTRVTVEWSDDELADSTFGVQAMTKY